MYTSSHNSYNHNVHRISPNAQIHQVTCSITTQHTKYSNAWNVLDSYLDSCGTN